MPSIPVFILTRRAIALCVLSGALALGVSACGSSSSSTTTAASAGAGAGAAGTSSATYTARLNYAKCMRAHGVNVPDPSANAGPAGGAGAGGFRAQRSSPNFPAASTACAKYRSKAFGAGSFSPTQRAQLQQELVNFARCMRTNGVTDIPDPSTSSGGGFGIFRQIPSTERQSPVFQAALKKCSSTLPRFGRGGAGGGPPAGGASSA
jgi:hypothetical protein